MLSARVVGPEPRFSLNQRWHHQRMFQPLPDLATNLVGQCLETESGVIVEQVSDDVPTLSLCPGGRLQ